MLRRGLLVVAALSACDNSTSRPPAAPVTAAACDRSVDASSADAYTASFVRLVGCDAPAVKTEIRERLVVRVDHAGSSLDISLERPWLACQTDATRCAEELADFVRGALEATRAPATTAAMLRVVVRHESEVPTEGPGIDAVLASPFVADLVVIAAADEPSSIKYLSAKDLTALGLTRDQAIDQARRNTADALGPLSSVVKDVPASGLGMLYADDVYEASRLVFADDWRPVADRFGGKLLVAAPARDLVMYADGRPPGARKALTAIVADAHAKASRPLSTAILRWTAAGWVAL